jgi:hypothetical protein
MTAQVSVDVVEAMRAEMALIGHTPTEVDVMAVMRGGFRPARYMVVVDGKPFRFAINRLAAKVAARSAGHLHPEAVIEVEHRPTGERATAAMDGGFAHREDAYHPARLHDDLEWLNQQFTHHLGGHR